MQRAKIKKNESRDVGKARYRGNTEMGNAGSLLNEGKGPVGKKVPIIDHEKKETKNKN